MHASTKFARAALLCAVAGTMIGSVTMARADDDDRGEGHDQGQALIRRGFQIVPSGVHLNLSGKDRALVGLGSYIVNTGGCNDCHTSPSFMVGGDPYRGQPELVSFAVYLAGGQHFGPFTSANITPDYSGKPAGLTLNDFIKTLRTGHNPNDPPGQILQVMPWPAFGKKTDHELKAVYEYLRAIPSLPNNY